MCQTGCNSRLFLFVLFQCPGQDSVLFLQGFQAVGLPCSLCLHQAHFRAHIRKRPRALCDGLPKLLLAVKRDCSAYLPSCHRLYS